jgi:hypothetical protein
MTPPILNIGTVELQPWGHGVSIPGAGEASDRYQARLVFLGRHLGAPRELRFVGRPSEWLDHWLGE